MHERVICHIKRQYRYHTCPLSGFGAERDYAIIYAMKLKDHLNDGTDFFSPDYYYGWKLSLARVSQKYTFRRSVVVMLRIVAMIVAITLLPFVFVAIDEYNPGGGLLVSGGFLFMWIVAAWVAIPIVMFEIALGLKLIRPK